MMKSERCNEEGKKLIIDETYRLMRFIIRIV